MLRDDKAKLPVLHGINTMQMNFNFSDKLEIYCQTNKITSSDRKYSLL